MIRRRTELSTGSEQPVDADEISIVVNVRIGNNIINQDINDALNIPSFNELNPMSLSKIMSENPSLHARWNALYNEAVYEYDILKTKFEVWIAKKSKEYRDELNKISKDEKIRVTDKLVEDTLKSDPEYESISNDLSEAKKSMKHILAVANGFGEKGEKIINIASMIKWEAEILAGNKKADSGRKYSPIVKRNSKIDGEKEYKININDNGGWPTQ